MEEWKDVVGFEGHYIVSNEGRVKNIFFRGKPRDSLLTKRRGKVLLGNKPNHKSYRVDYLVAKAFLPKSKVMEVVIHLNGDAEDNNASNLAWSDKTLKEYKSEIYSTNSRFEYSNWYEKDGLIFFRLENNGKYGICDKKTWDELKNYRWISTPMNYIVAYRNKKRIRFHQMVLPPKEGYVIDHINHNRYDNRICNLRYASARANTINHSVSKKNKIGVTGVTMTKNGKYIAYIWCGKSIYLGRYTSIEDAIKAREEAEIKYFKPILDRETHI